MRFIDAAASSIPFPKSVYGNMVSTTTNSLYHADHWYEVEYWPNLWQLYVVTESRRTNVTYHQIVTNLQTGNTASTTRTYNGVKYEYSYRWNQHASNFELALLAYHLGWPVQVFNYYGPLRTVVENFHLLP